MKLFGWALIIAGGGLVVVGARKLLIGSGEDDDVAYDPGDDPESGWIPAKTQPDLNDGV